MASASLLLPCLQAPNEPASQQNQIGSLFRVKGEWTAIPSTTLVRRDKSARSLKETTYFSPATTCPAIHHRVLHQHFRTLLDSPNYFAYSGSHAIHCRDSNPLYLLRQNRPTMYQLVHRGPAVTHHLVAVYLTYCNVMLVQSITACNTSTSTSCDNGSISAPRVVLVSPVAGDAGGGTSLQTPPIRLDTANYSAMCSCFTGGSYCTGMCTTVSSYDLRDNENTESKYALHMP